MADTVEQKLATEVAPVVAQIEQVEQIDTPVAQSDKVDTPATTEPEEDEKSKKVTLADLSARGTRLHANKQFEEAAEVFSRAAELQEEINGDGHPDNGEILFLYGRSLFKVGQSKSDVLGGKAPEAGAEKPQPKKQAPPSTSNEATTEAEKVTQEGLAAVAEQTSGAQKPETAESKKPLFQFEGDGNFDESDDEEGADEGDAEGEEEDEDDFQVAHDILEVARVSFQKHLEKLQQENGNAESAEKGKDVAEGESSLVRHVKERLADTNDLLAEIYLESENFPSAIEYSRMSLDYKKELFPPESEVIAEAHFKLSLALEFASVTTTEAEAADNGPQPFDEKLRAEAITELEAAIESTRLKLKAKEVELAEMANPEDNIATKASISDVRDIIEDMEERLKEMKKPPVDLKATLEAATGTALQGILGSVLGESAADVEKRVEEAKKSANDVSGLVKKKKKVEPTATESPAETGDSNGTKRKAEEPAEEDSAKKAKVEEAA